MDGEEEPAAELKASPKQQQPKTQTRTPTHPRKVPLARPVVKPCRLLPVIREEVEIEMEVRENHQTLQSLCVFPFSTFMFVFAARAAHQNPPERARGGDLASLALWLKKTLET